MCEAEDERKYYERAMAACFFIGIACGLVFAEPLGRFTRWVLDLLLR